MGTVILDSTRATTKLYDDDDDDDNISDALGTGSHESWPSPPNLQVDALFDRF